MATKRFAYVFAAVGFTSACGSSDGGPYVPDQGQGLGGAIGNTGGLPPATGGFTPSAGGALATGGQLATGGAGGTSSGGTSSGGTSSGGASSGGAAGGTGGTSSGGAASGGSGGGAPVVKPPCLTDAKQIALMGDSYVSWVSHTFPTDINAVSGLTIGNYAIGGTSMGSGGIGLIPTQLDTLLASQPNPIAIILDGGGNDVLVADTAQFPQGADCKNKGAQSPSIPDCQKIVEKALAAGRALFLRMASKGVKDAVFFFYPTVPTGTLIGGTDPNGMNEYARPKIKADCDGAYAESVKADPTKPIRCHFVDMVPVFAGQDKVFADGDIHPNPKGSKLMADAIWARMKQECIAQPASSGCCTP
jgi:lysophospholipase L1-like esterase